MPSSPAPTRPTEFAVWAGGTLVADHAVGAPKPWVLRSGCNAVAAFEVPFLPEPSSADSGKASRDSVNRQHRDGLFGDLARMIRGLYTPDLWRGQGDELNLTFVTFELRLTNNRFGRSDACRATLAVTPARLRLFVLVKAFAVESSADPIDTDRAFARARSRAAEAAARLRAQAPRDLPLQSLRWLAPDQPAGSDPAYAYATTDQVGLLTLPTCRAAGELRRPVFASRTTLPYDVAEYRQAVDAGELWTVPRPWRAGTHDLLPTCSAMSAAATGVMLCVRLQPTAKTPAEIRAIHDARRALVNRNKENRIGAELMKVMDGKLKRFLFQRELFASAVQVVGEYASAVEDVLMVLAGEHAAGRPELRTRAARPAGHPPSAVLAVSDDTSGELSYEMFVARHNVTHMDFVPWGGVSPAVADAALPDVLANSDSGLFQPLFTLGNDRLSPELLHERDTEIVRDLSRWRGLVSVEEAAALWRVPVPGMGGHAGLVSRQPDPFEQIPRETPAADGAIRLGRVQHRGVETTQDFRVPFYKDQIPVAGIGDRVTVVAGSPGSGKTNFCLNFLSQLWTGPNKPADVDVAGGGGLRSKCPYLVIDPTRGNEFRALGHWAGDDLLVFTVGDSRGVPFCFNPFLVPAGVSVQSHVSRLMSCFKAAFQMWDPLPAIFEMAIRRAYEGRRRQWYESTHPGVAWNAAEDFAAGNDEPFPRLDDVLGAMGKGGDDDIWPVDGRPTVMAGQKEMWGQGTENSATIVASTFLRLESLNSNYAHVIGGPGPGRECVDIDKLLDRPCVLELGMVGEASALSLVMGFLLTCVAGTIENPRRKKTPSDDPKFPRDYPVQMLVIEEAHRLLGTEGGGGGKESGSSKAQAAEDINNMLAEVRKFGLGVMLLDQRPASLVGGVIDNAYLIAMHRLNEQSSFKQFSEMLNLSADHQRFARTELRPGEMVTLDRRTGVPVLLRAPILDPIARELGKTSDDAMAARVLPNVPGVYLSVTSGLTAAQCDAARQSPQWPKVVELLAQAVIVAQSTPIKNDHAREKRRIALQADQFDVLRPKLDAVLKPIIDAVARLTPGATDAQVRAIVEAIVRLGCNPGPGVGGVTSGVVEIVIDRAVRRTPAPATVKMA